jgi:uncharacterized protein (TIGR03437 family)
MAHRFRFFLCLAAIGGLVCAAPRDRITRAVDSAQRTVLAGHIHPAVHAGSDRGAVDAGFPIRDAVLFIRPSAEQQSELDRLLADQQNPSSPQFRQWLTPEQYGERFGLSPGDHSRVAAWLHSQGLTVNQSGRARNWVGFSGTAEQVSRAFRTPIRRFEVNGRPHYANTAEPAVPSALADVVGGVFGLNDFKPVSNPRVAEPEYTSGRNHYVVPEDFATIYNLKPLYQAGYDGTGQSIAVLGQEDLSIDDIRAFRKRYGLPANDPKFLLAGSAPTSPGLEANLDVEWAGAVAPNATIYYVYSTNVYTALVGAVNANVAPVITISYGSCEGNASPLYFRTVAQQANAQGITILSASGDGGAAGCYDQFTPFAMHGPQLVIPAALPEVTAVGGTQFNEGTGTYWATTNSANLGSALSYIPEVVWNETVPGSSVAGGTGGASIMFAKPAWQQGPGVPGDNARSVPDVSMAAAVHDGYLVTYNLGNYVVGGTSASAPVLAGIIAVLNQYQVAKGYQKTPGLGNINPHLYRLAQAAPSAFHDIVEGDNMVPCTQGSPGCVTGFYGHKAVPGYDMATGLGSVDAYNFVTQWNIPTRGVTVNLVANLSRASLNESVNLTALVGAANGTGMPVGAVGFSVGTTALGTVPLAVRGSLGAADITVPAYLLGGTGAYTVYAHYSGDSTFSGGGNSLRLTLTAPAGVSAIVPSVASNPVWPTPDSQGLVWQETVRLRDAGGVASLLTEFTIDGVPQKLSDYFPSPAIPPNTTVSSTPLVFRNLASYPVTRTFGFRGVDATGLTWSREISALFLGPPTYSGGFLPTLVPLTMNQDSKADPACQWSQTLFVDEIAGSNSSVSALWMGAVNASTKIPAILGTTRLQGWGSLQGTLCWGGVTPGTSDVVTVTMSNGLSEDIQVNFAGPVQNPVKISATPMNVSLSAPDSKAAAKAAIAVTLSDKTQPWTASVFPANAATTWLKVGPLAGTGTGNIALSASGDGFGPGVYRATIILGSPNAMPATVAIPVMFVYGDSSGMSIKAIGSTANFRPTASPGMLVSVFGSQLANTTKQASAAPLPFSLEGVSARVNGLDAPVQYVSPNQLNIQVPYEAGAGPAVLGIHNNGRVAGFQFQIAPSAPGIFADADGNLVPAATVRAGGTATLYLTGDGDVTPSLLTGFTPSSGTAATSLPKSRLPLSVTVGGAPAFVLYYGVPPGLVGVSQVNFAVPASVKPGVQPVVVTVGGAASPPVNLAVEN